MKKIFITIVLVVMMFIPAAVCANSSVDVQNEYGDKLYGKLLLLKNMGYFDELPLVGADEKVSRAEFAHWLNITINMTDIKMSSPYNFSDINEKTLYYADIQNITALGYMNGTDSNMFLPYDNISLQEAATALVRVTGYEPYAKLDGGWPSGYESIANDLKLYDGVVRDDSRINILVMVYNALVADYLTPIGFKSNNIIYEKGDTVLGHFHSIYKVEGVVTANGFTKIYSSDHVSDRNTIEIEKNIFKAGQDYDDLLGMHIKGFYHYDKKNGENVIISAYADSNKNNVTVIEAEDILEYENLKLSYELGGSKRKNATIERGFSFIYNNRIAEDRTDSDILIKDGQLTLVDSDGDDKYETIIARVPETMRISGVDMYNQIVYTDIAALNRESYEYAYAVYKMYDGEFREISLDEIERDSIATVYRSHDGLYLEILISTASLYAAPSTIGTDYALIDGIEYKFARSEEKDKLVLGEKTDIFLDVYGRIAYVSESKNYKFQYGYTFKTWYDDNTDKVYIKMITPVGQKVYGVNDHLTIDGISKSESGDLPNLLSREIVRYKLDASGNINAIDRAGDSNEYKEDTNSLTRYADAGSIMYYPESKTFFADGRCRATANSFMVVVPEDPEEKDDIDLYVTSYNNYAIDPAGYTFELYDVDEEDLSVGAYIYYHSGKFRNPTTNFESPAAVVEKYIDQYYDEESGEIVRMIKMNDNGKQLSYIIDKGVSRTVTDNLSFGDVVRYKMNTEGHIGGLAIELDVNSDSPDRASVMVGILTNYRYSYGYIESYQNDYLVLKLIDDSAKVTVPTSQVYVYTLVDMTENKITKMDSKYYATYIKGQSTPSYAYARVYKNFRTLDLVIYKY